MALIVVMVALTSVRRVPGPIGALQSPGFAQCFAQYEFDLRIQTAQIVPRPALHRFKSLRIDPQRE